MTFSTVEDFWAVYHHVALPSRLHIGADYMVFKAGIAPKWEDVQNAKGGSWVLETGKKQKEHLDAGWLESLLACIGERKCSKGGITSCICRARDLPQLSSVRRARR